MANADKQTLNRRAEGLMILPCTHYATGQATADNSMRLATKQVSRSTRLVAPVAAWAVEVDHLQLSRSHFHSRATYI